VSGIEIVAVVIAGVVLVVATLLLVGGAIHRRRAERRRARDAFSTLSAIRSESGRPFFPETSEELRREKRILSGWDPTYEGGEGADPRSW
jgi:hypothetical protein